MQIRVGFELIYYFPQPTPVILMVDVHFSRASDVVSHEYLTTDSVPVSAYRDGFGNWCSRIFAPRGQMKITSSAVVRDSGLPDAIVPDAWQHTVESLPEETLVFLLGSRYCETDLLSQTAWNLFGHTVPGWQRVQAICDYVHNHIFFNYQNARATRDGLGSLCRPHRRVPRLRSSRRCILPLHEHPGPLLHRLSGRHGHPCRPTGSGDFAAWFEVYLGGAWHTFDARNNTPRIGRVLIARGRDAADVAIATTFGANALEGFTVWG